MSSTVDDAIAQLAGKFAAQAEALEAEPTEEAPPPEFEPEDEPVLEAAESGEPEPPESGETDEADEPFQTLADLLAAGEVSADALTVDIKVDGEMQRVPLAEALEGYSREADYRRKTSQVAEDRRQLEVERSEKLQALIEAEQSANQMMAFVQHWSEHAEAQVHQMWSGQNWQQLQATDPGQYAAQQLQYRQQLDAISAQRQQMQAQYQQFADHARLVAESQAAETAKASRRQLLERYPELSDDTKLQERLSGTFTYLQRAYGAQERELAGLTDWRILDIAHKAALYDQIQDGAKRTLKQGGRQAALPAGPSAGGGKRRLRAAAAKEHSAKERLQKSGEMEDAVALLSQRIAMRG